MIAVLVVTLFATIFVWFLKIRWVHRKFYHLASKIPTAKGNFPIFGITHKFVGGDSYGAHNDKLNEKCSVFNLTYF